MEFGTHGFQGIRYSIWKSLFLGLLMTLGAALPSSAFAILWLPQELAVFELVNQQRAINNVHPLQMDSRLHASALGHSQSMSDNDFFSHTTLLGNNGRTPGDRLSSVGYDYAVGGENIAGGYGRTYDPPAEPVVMEDPLDAAHHVMFGATDLGEINSYFYLDNAYVDNPIDSWEEVGIGISGDEWDAWFSDKGGEGGWMGSHDHREVLLNADFDDTGVGYVWEPKDADNILLDGGRYSGFPINTYWTQDFASGDSLAPVPLPGAFWLLASGLAGMTLVGRRRGVMRMRV